MAGLCLLALIRFLFHVDPENIKYYQMRFELTNSTSRKDVGTTYEVRTLRRVSLPLPGKFCPSYAVAKIKTKSNFECLANIYLFNLRNGKGILFSCPRGHILLPLLYLRGADGPHTDLPKQKKRVDIIVLP